MADISSSIDQKQREGVAWDIIAEAINGYHAFMLYREGDPQEELNLIVERMEQRRNLYRSGSAMAQTFALRNERQLAVFDWATAAFGEAQATSIQQRCVRFIEEAIEACQAGGLDKQKIHELVDYVYARPVGELPKEIGAVGIVLMALAAAAGVSADEQERIEFERIMAKPIEYYTARNAAKNEAGFLVAEEAKANG